jgi:hypothetical protein
MNVEGVDQSQGANGKVYARRLDRSLKTGTREASRLIASATLRLPFGRQQCHF